MKLAPTPPKERVGWPLRFKTIKDAMLFMECVRTGTPYPASRHVYPFVMIYGKAERNPEYAQARYELRTI